MRLGCQLLSFINICICFYLFRLSVQYTNIIYVSSIYNLLPRFSLSQVVSMVHTASRGSTCRWVLWWRSSASGLQVHRRVFRPPSAAGGGPSCVGGPSWSNIGEINHIDGWRWEWLTVVPGNRDDYYSSTDDDNDSERLITLNNRHRLPTTTNLDAGWFINPPYGLLISTVTGVATVVIAGHSFTTGRRTPLITSPWEIMTHQVRMMVNNDEWSLVINHANHQVNGWVP